MNPSPKNADSSAKEEPAPKAEKATKTTKAAAKKPAATKKATPKAAAKSAAKKPAKTTAPSAKKTTASKATPTSKGAARKLTIKDAFPNRQYTFATGKRKTAVATVRLYPQGKGKCVVNNLASTDYFVGTGEERMRSPLAALGMEKTVDISIRVTGGGLSAQAEAARHGIARAAVVMDAEHRPALKKAGLLTRDARRKERKKPGLRRARRSPQWSKR